MLPLSIVAVGHVHFDSIEPLTKQFGPVEELVLDIHPRSDLEAHRAELNRAVDAGNADWVLIVRERETVSETLAKEIAAAAADPPRAWGYRIRTQPLYLGAPLQLGDRAGELRLFHRRHFLRRGDLNVQGTVIRLNESFRAVTFETADEHRRYLAEHGGVARSPFARALLFARNVIGTRTLDRTTLRYLWIEAAFARS